MFSSDNADSYCEYASFTLSAEKLLEIVIGDISDIHVKTAANNSKIGSVRFVHSFNQL